MTRRLSSVAARTARLAGVGLATCLAVTSCSIIDGGNDVDPLTELQSRPSFEAAVDTYRTMDREIREAITTASPQVQWEVRNTAIKAGCSEPFDNLGGSSLRLELQVAQGGIDDATWPEALTAAGDVAARHGMTDLAVVVDQPGRHQVRFFNPTDGAYANFGTDVNATLLVITGCNLPADALSTTPPATS